MRGREKVTILLKETSPVLQRRIQTKNSLLLSLLFLLKREEKEKERERKKIGEPENVPGEWK